MNIFNDDCTECGKRDPLVEFNCADSSVSSAVCLECVKKALVLLEQKFKVKNEGDE